MATKRLGVAVCLWRARRIARDAVTAGALIACGCVLFACSVI